VEALPLEGNSCAATAVSFLQQVRAHHPTPLVVFWGNAPVHGGDPLRDYLRTPDLRLRLVRLPADSPDFNAAEHIWTWVRAEVRANTCFDTADTVRAHVAPFFAGLATRKDEVEQRCRTELQSRADALDAVRVAPTHAPRCPKGGVDACKSHPGFTLVPRTYHRPRSSFSALAGVRQEAGRRKSAPRPAVSA
jgi:transposase